MYIVTGCAGFIASRVTAILLEQGHRVLGVDNLNSAYDPRLKHWRLEHLKNQDGFEFLEADISEKGCIQSIATAASRAAEEIAAVVNLAARAGVQPSVEDPYTYFATNVTGTLNMLELCRNHDVKKFLLASTSSAYGQSTPGPTNEGASSERPLSPYAASKKSAEVLAHTYHHLHGIDVSIPRYFTVYGPAGRPDMSVFRFIRWIATGQPLILTGDGEQERDFTFIDDIARGTVAALKPVGYEIVNLGSDRPVTINRVIGMIEEMVEKKAIIDRRPFHPADVKATWADISKARSLLGWEPRQSLEAGLQAAVDWYRENEELASSLNL